MNETRTKKVSRNIIFATIFQLTKAVLLFISRVIFAKILGPQYLGINGLFSNVLTVLSLADLGINSALMYSLYKPLANDNKEEISAYMNFFKKMYNLIALVVFLLGIMLIPFLKYIINLPNDVPHIYIYYIILLLNSVISYLFIYKTTLLAADQKQYILNKYDTIFQVILFVLQILVLVLTKSFALYLSLNILCTFTGNLFKVRAANKVYPYLKDNKSIDINKASKKDIFSNIKSMFIYKIGGIIQSNTDSILISIFVGTITVGYYSNYSLIVMEIVAFITLMFTSLKASVGNYNITNNSENQYRIFNMLEVYNFWIVGFCSVCLLTLTPTFIQIFFGKDYALSQLFLIFLISNFYTSNIRQTLWVYRETSGIFNKTKYVTMVTAVINILLSIIMGYYFGLSGIVLATVISRMLYAWWKEPLVIYKDIFHKSANEYFIKYIVRIIIIAFIYILIELIFKFININNMILLLIIKAVVSVIIIALVFFIVYRKNEAFSFITDKLKGELHGKRN